MRVLHHLFGFYLADRTIANTPRAVLGRFRLLHPYGEHDPGGLLVPLLLRLQVYLPSLALSPRLPVSCTTFT